MKRPRAVQILILILLIALTALGIWPLQHFISQRMEYLKSEAISFLERTTGRQIRYNSVSPSVLRYLEINRMRILSDGNENEDLLVISRIRVYYNIFKLLGRNPGQAFSRVSIEDSTLTIDLVEDQDLIDLIRKLSSQLLSGGNGNGEVNLVLSGRNMNLSITKNDASVSVTDLFFDLSTRAEKPEVELSGDVSCTLPQLGALAKNLSASLKLSGTFSRDMSEATLKPSISELKSGDLTLAAQTYQLSLSEGSWHLTKVQDRLPLDFSMSYQPADGVIKASFAAAGFAPRSLLEYSGNQGALAKFRGFLDATVSGRGNAEYDLESGDLGYQGQLDLVLPGSIGPFSNIKAAGGFEGDLKKVTLSKVKVATDQGSVEFNGTSMLSPILPSGTVRVTDLVWPLQRPVSGSFVLSAGTDRIEVSSDGLDIGGIALRSLGAAITISNDRVGFTTGFEVGKGEPGRIDAEGSVGLGKSPEVEISDVSVSNLPLSLLIDLAGIENSADVLPREILGMKIDAGAFVQSAAGRYLFSVPTFTARTPGGNSVTARITGNNNSVTVSDLELTWGEITLTGGTTLDITDLDNLKIRVSLNMFDTAYSLEGVLKERNRFVFTGSYGLNGSIARNDPGISIELHTVDLPVRYKDINFNAALNITGSYVDNDNWNLVSEESSFGPVALPMLGEIRTVFSGSVTPTLITANQIRILDQYSELAGTGQLEYSISRADAFAGKVTLENSAEGERYEAEFTLKDDEIDAKAKVTGGMLQRIGNFPVSGRVSGEITAKGPLSFPDLSASFSLENGVFAGDSITASADVTLDEEQLKLEKLNLDYVSSRIRDGSGSLEFQNGAFSLVGGFSSSFRDRIVTSDLLISGAFDEAFGRDELKTLGKRDFRGTVRAGNISFGDEHPEDWVFDVVRYSDGLTVNGGPHNGMKLVTKSDKSFILELTDPLPIIGTARGVITEGKIDAELVVSNLDMEGMESILVIPFFNITSGKAYGSLLVSGRLNDPDIYGDLYGRDLLAKVRVVPETIGPFTAQLSFNGKTLSINRTLLPAGAAQVYGTADFTLDHWLPTTFEIQLTTASDPGIHIKNNFGRVDTDGYGRGDLRISGDPFAIELTGKLVVSNGSVIIGAPPPPGGGGTPVIADIQLVTGKKVVFLWPNRSLPILTAYADTGQQVKIQTNPLIDSLEIDGEVDVKSGEVFYFQRGFRITEGKVVLKEDQNSVDPHISVRAETRDVSDAGEEVRIYLVIDNQPFSQFKPRFESTPPMSQTEIYAALGQNLREDMGGDFYGLSSALLITSDIFSQFGVVRSLEQRVRDLLNLDLFSIRTHILQNVLSERLIPADSGLVPGNPSASRYLDNTTLFLGKYFGNDIFLEAMVRLRVNEALLSNTNAGDDLYVDSEIRLEWKTPLFLLELSLLPDISDPLSSIQRAKLGLSWDIWY